MRGGLPDFYCLDSRGRIAGGSIETSQKRVKSVGIIEPIVDGTLIGTHPEGVSLESKGDMLRRERLKILMYKRLKEESIYLAPAVQVLA